MARKKSYEETLMDDLIAGFSRGDSTAKASFIWESSTDVKDWVSTGDFMLDVVLSNKINGGLPVGRLSEISGGEGAGKTLLGSYILANTQKKGGVAIMIDTEHAASMDVLKAAGVDVEKLIYIQAGTHEEVFQAMETITNRIKSEDTDKLITIVWDSVAATSTKAEVEGGYGDKTIGLAARIIGQGLRKIMPVVSRHNVCLVLINQLRTNIGQTFGDNKVAPGGMSIGFHASVRLRLNHFKQIKDSNGDLIGRIVKCEVKKNKVAPPMRTMYYTIRWGDKPGAWIEGAETMWDSAIRADVLKKVTAQKYKVALPSGEMEFTKRAFANLLEEDQNFTDEFHAVLAKAYIITQENIKEEDIQIVDAPSNEGMD